VYRMGKTWQTWMRRVRRTIDAHEQVLIECVASARASGATWEEIGVVLGTTAQAAQQRFGPKIGNVSEPIVFPRRS
jgi:hypothetical protein